MTADPVTISRSNSVIEAARLMETADVGSVPVVDGGTPVGIVTDRDIAIRVVAHGMDPSGTQVSEIATAQPYYVHPDQCSRRNVVAVSTERMYSAPALPSWGSRPCRRRGAPSCRRAGWPRRETGS